MKHAPYLYPARGINAIIAEENDAQERREGLSMARAQSRAMLEREVRSLGLTAPDCALFGVPASDSTIALIAKGSHVEDLGWALVGLGIDCRRVERARQRDVERSRRKVRDRSRSR